MGRQDGDILPCKLVPLSKKASLTFSKRQAETLKYLFLLFSDASVVPLKDFVFNTEVGLRL